MYNYIYIHPELETIGNFHRKKFNRDGRSDDDWLLIAGNVSMQMRPRRPSGNARPEVEFDDIVATGSQWYWARMAEVNLNIRLGDRLTRLTIGGRTITTDDTECEGLFIIQNDILGPVHHLLLSDTERSV